MASFPGSIWTPPPRGVNMSDAVTQTAIQDEQNDEIVAIQTAVGASAALTLAYLAQVSVAATTASGVVSNNLVRVVRHPIPGSKYLVTVYGSMRNNKGSAFAAGDDLLTIPAGYRPEANQTVTCHSISGNSLHTASISMAGLVEIQAGASGIAHAQYVWIHASYETP